MNNGQWGRWRFDNQMPMLAVPSYARYLPRDQRLAFNRAATSAHGLMYGWIPEDHLHSHTESFTDQQTLDLTEASKKIQQGISEDPWLNPSNEQAGIADSQARVSNPRRDVVFYQRSIPDEKACTRLADEDQVDSKPSDKSLDSLQSAGGGKWHDPKFKVAGLHPFGNRLVAGINCPPNVLQQCNLRRNWYGGPPRFIPHTPAFQRRSPQMDPMIVVNNVEGRQEICRGELERFSPLKDRNSSLHRIDPDFFSHFGILMARSSQVRIVQANEYATCDNHECTKVLGPEYVACARCHQARYCSKFCQIFTWLVHLPTCILHPEANAPEVAALEEWATEMWLGAAKAVKDAEEARAHGPMHVDGEDSCTDIHEPYIRESSVSTSSTTSDDAMLDNEDDEDRQTATEAVIESHFTAVGNRGEAEVSKEVSSSP